MPTRHQVCHIKDLTKKATGFEIISSQEKIKLIIVSLPDGIFAYLNRCPHTGINLEWKPQEFMDSSGDFLQCSTHGALFEPATGLCTYGPCNGQSLPTLSIEIKDEILFVYI